MVRRAYMAQLSPRAPRRSGDGGSAATGYGEHVRRRGSVCYVDRRCHEGTVWATLVTISVARWQGGLRLDRGPESAPEHHRNHSEQDLIATLVKENVPL